IHNSTAAQDYSLCQFSANSADGFGGAVYLTNSGGGSFSGCTFAGNQSGNHGGALYVGNNSSPALGACSFVGNSSVTSGGGVANSGSTPAYVNCGFSGNSAQSGGAVLNAFSSTPSFTSCTIIGNLATSRGGGVYTAGSVSTFTNCMIAGNAANNSGGGIFNETSSSSTWKFVLVNCSLSGNSAGFGGGGGIDTNASGALAADSEITNTIIWNNQSNGSTLDPEASINFGGTAAITYSHSLVEHFDLTGVGTANLDGTDYAGAPHFVAPYDPAAAPSTTGDLGLTLGSPAIDSGDNAANSEPTDLAGDPRVAGGTIDLGAYEGGTAHTDSDGDCLPDAWELAFGEVASTTGLDPASDLDGDGLSALVEFGFGLNPDVPNGTADYILAGTEVVGADEYLTVTYHTNPAAAGFVAYDVYRTTDLDVADPWDTGETVFVSSAGPWITERSIFPITAQPKEFLRVKLK
ncbi:MAG: right-handed parallel beta-helix repeat-containing protein, partial [Akkermansiaceae bacterium]|nr:right-handed parallel beta-helix repeat-containing protein [Akkermansiaceae bacterium]